MKVIPMDVKTLDELTTALTTAARERVYGLFAFPNRDQLGADDVQDDNSVAAGGLISYYSNWTVLRKRAAIYVDRILKG